MFTFQTEEDRMSQMVENVFKVHEVSADELQFLLACRAKKKLDFLLIDIREIFEYSDLSIKGTDFLLPTSTLHLSMDTLASYKNHMIILYCRTASRTFQVVHILKRMGFEKIAHLEGGIVSYRGEKLKNAPLPQHITCKG